MKQVAAMADDKFDRIGPILNEIGVEIARIVGGDPEGALFYAEVEEGYAFLSVYRDEGETIRYFDPEGSLSDLTFDAWYAEEDDKRWAAMTYRVRNGRLNVTLGYPDELDVGDLDAADERRDSAIRQYLGDKPVIYPPFPDDVFELRPDSG